MIKLGTVFWLVLVSMAGFAMFAVKYGVQSLEDELNRTKKATIAEEHAIRADEAEWAYLTRPETLDEMNRRHLSLGPIATKQLRIALSDIPLRATALMAVDAPALAEPQAEGTVPAIPVSAIAPALPEKPAEAAVPAIPVSAIAPALPEKPAEAAELVKPAPAKATAKPVPTRHPRSLDELIAQVAAGR
jgi:hypothetical protein